MGAFYRAVAVMRPRRVVVYFAYPDFARKSEAIADLLRRRGFRSDVRSGLSFLGRARVKFSPDLYIGFWNEFHFYPAYLPRRYIFFNAEPLHIPKWKDDADWFAAMRGALQVWGYARHHEAYVTPLGVPYRYVPFGYAPYYEEHFRANTQGKSLPQDIDVLFVGHMSERRQNLVDRMTDLGLAVHTVTGQTPVFGEKLDELLARAKIVLNVYTLDDPATHIADFARLDHLLSNRRFVIHEKLSTLAPDEAFEKHVITCPYDEIPAKCSYYLARPGEREEIAEAAYQWFKSERALDASIPYDDIRHYLSAAR